MCRNLGEEYLSEAKVTGWQCCCCIPSQLEVLISECDKALSGLESSDPESSNTEFSGPENNDPVRYLYLHNFLCILQNYLLVIPTANVISKQKMKKKIRRIMDDTELGEETKRKIAMEKVVILLQYLHFFLKKNLSRL